MLQTDKLSKAKFPLLFKLLLIFVFFFPLRSVQIPVGVFGVEINPARIASTLFTILLFINVCLDVRYFHKFFRYGRCRNQYVLYFFVYTLFSIAYYYLLVAAGKTILFGAGETAFLLNWRGRPFAQLLALITYGIIPFYLVQYYAQYARARRNIERVLIWAILLLVYFACIQVITYIIFRVPLVGKDILGHKYDLGYLDILGIPLYRVNSIGGEPRDLATFLLGAIPFYAYVSYGRMSIFTKMNILFLVLTFFLADSNSAFLALGVVMIAIIIDAIYRRRIRIRFKYIKYGLVALCIGIVIFRAQIVEIVGSRAIMMYEGIVAQLQTQEVQPIVREQTSNLVIFYYILHTLDRSPASILFGSGYSNFITPMRDLYRLYFHREIDSLGTPTSDSFAGKLLVEGGVIGMGFYGMMAYRTLQLNGKLLAFFRKRKQWYEYRKALLLRVAFLAFFIAGAIQISYYYFIIMGLIAGWLNEVARREECAMVTKESANTI